MAIASELSQSDLNNGIINISSNSFNFFFFDSFFLPVLKIDLNDELNQSKIFIQRDSFSNFKPKDVLDYIVRDLVVLRYTYVHHHINYLVFGNKFFSIIYINLRYYI